MVENDGGQQWEVGDKVGESGNKGEWGYATPHSHLKQGGGICLMPAVVKRQGPRVSWKCQKWGLEHKTLQPFVINGNKVQMAEYDQRLSITAVEGAAVVTKKMRVGTRRQSDGVGLASHFQYKQHAGCLDALERQRMSLCSPRRASQGRSLGSGGGLSTLRQQWDSDWQVDACEGNRD